MLIEESFWDDNNEEIESQKDEIPSYDDKETDEYDEPGINQNCMFYYQAELWRIDILLN